MSFVEVEGAQIIVSQIPKHPQPSYPEDQLLKKPVALISSVELPGELAILRAVAIEICIQEVDREGEPSVTDKIMYPGADPKLAPLHVEGDLIGEKLQELLRLPFHGALLLPSLPGKFLIKISLSVEQCYSHHGNSQIGGTLEDIPRKNPEASGVRGDLVADTDLHGTVGDGAERRIRLYGVSKGLTQMFPVKHNGHEASLLGGKWYTLNRTLWYRSFTLAAQSRDVSPKEPERASPGRFLFRGGARKA